MRGNRTPQSLLKERKRYHCTTRLLLYLIYLVAFSPCSNKMPWIHSKKERLLFLLSLLSNRACSSTVISSRETKEASTIKWASFDWVLNMASDKMYLQKVITKNQTPKCVSIFQQSNYERASVAQTPNFIFCSPISPDNCGAVFFVKIYFSFLEMTFLVRPLQYANFHREYYPSCVTSCHEFTLPPVFLST